MRLLVAAAFACAAMTSFAGMFDAPEPVEIGGFTLDALDVKHHGSSTTFTALLADTLWFGEYFPATKEQERGVFELTTVGDSAVAYPHIWALVSAENGKDLGDKFKGLKSFQVLLEVQCPSAQVRKKAFIGYEGYFGKGTKVIEKNFDEEWRLPPPGAKEGRYAQFVCEGLLAIGG